MKPLTTCVLGVLFITLAAFARPAAAAFPGQNGKIALASNRSGNFEIYAANPDGSGLADLTATPGVDEFAPAWSADGRRLAYQRDGAIWVMNADGSGQTQLTPGSAGGEFANEPAWSPDGHQIAFHRLDSQLGIWIVSDGGGLERQLTSVRDESPAWSPDGQTIVAERHGLPTADRLVLIRADGSGEDLLVTGISSSNRNPSWSPDGTKIAFDVNGGEGIDVVDLGSGTVTAFGTGADPEWAPDGSALVYTTLVTIPPSGPISSEIQWRPWPSDGSAGRSVSGNDPATDRSPSWQPGSQNTPAGSNVTVALGSVTITFANVVVAGETTIVSATSGPPVPIFFQVASDYYELSTTATWDQAAGAEVCFTYSGSPAPQIVHFVGGTPTVVPTTATGRQVCGTVNSFSPFVLVRPAGDTTAPTISCDAPDGLWHAGNVSIQCAASDGGSGLADPADTSFALQTSVPAGVETDNAATSSHDVCDVAGNCATAGPIGGNKVDRKAPALNTPADLVVEATSPLAASVDVAMPTATDGGSGLASVNGPVGTASYPMGTTVLSWTAVDQVGNSSLVSSRVTVHDTTAPSLSLPANIVVNATSPSGAVVAYAASATDVGDANPLLICAPSSGSTFPIGQATVSCRALDRWGNSRDGSFTVSVKGAKEQLADLIQKVVNASQLSPSAKTLLIGKLNQLLASFDPSNATQRQAVCLALQAFKAAVQLQAGKTITQAQAAEWIADANRIRAVLGC